MTTRRRVLGIAASILVTATSSSAQNQPDDPKLFVRNLGDRAIGILRMTDGSAARKSAFLQFFAEEFDTPAIGRFVLGRYWLSATPEQRAQYLSLFSQYVVTLYANRFSSYSGEQFKVTASRQNDPSTATVTSQIIRSDGGPPITVGWQVARQGGAFKFTDVTIDNLSLAITKRDEFSSVIQQQGGDVQALIDRLRHKVQDD